MLLLLNLVNYGYYPQYFVQQYLCHLLDVGDCSDHLRDWGHGYVCEL